MVGAEFGEGLSDTEWGRRSVPETFIQLPARLHAAKPRDTIRGVVFNAAFNVIEELAGTVAALEWDPAGKGRRSEFFSYPVADFLRLTWAAADELEARGRDRASVFREFGSRAALRWLSCALGRTLVAFTGADPRRLLTHTATGYRNVVSYGTRTLEWLGDRRARLLFKGEFLVPPFHCGVLTAALESTCGGRFDVEGREIGFLESEYDVSW
jgi:uncharacterized protein (TIGR02265 family)